MQADLLIVQFCEFLDVGDGVHRFHNPSRALSRLPGVAVIDCDLHHRLLPKLLDVADVLVLAGFDWDMLPLLQRRRNMGRVTIFEANDYYYDVQPWNPLSVQWMDRSLQDSFRHGLIHADAVQTSSQPLADRWARRTSRPIAVFENQLTDMPPLAPPTKRPLTIGWGGSPGHFADWYFVAPVLEKWLRANPDVHVSVMNNEFCKPFLNLPEDRYSFRDFGRLTDYLDFLSGLDIGIAPLLPSEYNRCRSDVKFLEYASRGVAGIYADLDPYRNSVVDGQTGLIYRNEAELVTCLDRLTADAELRQKIRVAAHAYVSAERRLEQHIGKRLEFYKSLLPGGGSGRATVIPSEILAAAKIDGRYLQIVRQEPEKALKSTMDGPTTPANVQTLRQLVQAYPNYLSALQQLGKRLNDQRLHQEALYYLERAMAIDPDSARSKCEMGRAYFRLDQGALARRLLEEALTKNPCYQVGWQYLLVLLDRTKAADGPQWAQKAHEANPANFALAILGLKTYPRKQAIVRLRELIDLYVPTLLAEELPPATAAFSQAITEAVGPALGDANSRELLRHACAAFPLSSKLATLMARSLYLAGEFAESQVYDSRAHALRHVGRTWLAEFPKEDGSVHFGQFVEHGLSALKNSQP